MKKAHVLVLGILAVFLVSACNSNVDVGGNADPFIGGSTGLVIDFEEGSPPAEVTDDEFAFQAIIRVENQGEWKIDQGDISVELDGFLPTDFGQSGEQKISGLDEDLLPTRRDGNGNIIDGTTAFVDFPAGGGDYESDSRLGNVQFPFRANVCYSYGTRAAARICVLEDLTSPTENALCDPNAQSDIDSSGSPVQFQNYKQTIAGKSKIQFSFDVVHSGNGNLYSPDLSDCPDDAREIRKERDKVKVVVRAPDSLNNLRCSGLGDDGVIKLSRGKRTVTCTLDVESETDFEAIVDLQAQFLYNSFKETKVLVKHLVIDDEEFETI